MNKKILLAAGICTAVAFNANAWDYNPYAGVDLGWGKADIDKLEDKTGLNDLEDNFFVISANAGIRPSRYFGLETSILASGDSETEYGFGDVWLSYASIGVDAVAYIPLYKDKFEIFGTAGGAYHYMEMEVKRHRWWNEPNRKRRKTYDDDKFAPRVGFGFQYNMNEHFSFRVMGRYTFLDHKYVDSLTEVITGVRYNF